MDIRVPEGDTLPRHVCSVCNIIHYRNPKMVVGCIPKWENKVLLCRRAIKPRRGFWTLPAGFMENDESPVECCIREIKEETGLDLTRVSNTSPPLYSSAGMTDESVAMVYVECDGEPSAAGSVRTSMPSERIS